MALNILLVDDSETMRAMIRRVINLSGLETGEILEAGNGREALEALDHNWVDLVMTDIHMPEMDGLELLRNLARDDLLSELPVIVVTSDAGEDPVREALRLGARDYIRKPFSPEKMREILTKHVIGEA